MFLILFIQKTFLPIIYFNIFEYYQELAISQEYKIDESSKHFVIFYVFTPESPLLSICNECTQIAKWRWTRSTLEFFAICVACESTVYLSCRCWVRNVHVCFLWRRLLNFVKGVWHGISKSVFWTMTVILRWTVEDSVNFSDGKRPCFCCC